MDRAAKKVGFGLLVEVTWVFFILKIKGPSTLHPPDPYFIFAENFPFTFTFTPTWIKYWVGLLSYYSLCRSRFQSTIPGMTSRLVFFQAESGVLVRIAH